MDGWIALFSALCSLLSALCSLLFALCSVLSPVTRVDSQPCLRPHLLNDLCPHQPTKNEQSVSLPSPSPLSASGSPISSRRKTSTELNQNGGPCRLQYASIYPATGSISNQPFHSPSQRSIFLPPETNRVLRRRLPHLIRPLPYLNPSPHFLPPSG